MLEHRDQLQARGCSNAVPSTTDGSPPPTSSGETDRNSSSTSPARQHRREQRRTTLEQHRAHAVRLAQALHAGGQVELVARDALDDQLRPGTEAARGRSSSARRCASRGPEERRVDRQLERAAGRDCERHAPPGPVRRGGGAPRGGAPAGRSAPARSSPVPTITASTWPRRLWKSVAVCLARDALGPAPQRGAAVGGRDHVRDHVGAVRGARGRSARARRRPRQP